MNNESPYSQSMMRPALTVIRIFFVLGIIGAVVLGIITIVGIAALMGVTAGRATVQEVVSFGILFATCLCSTLSLYILRCVVLCLGSMELTLREIEQNTMTLREIEKNTRKDRRESD